MDISTVMSLIEASDIKGRLQKIMTKWKKEGVDLFLYGDKDYIKIQTITIPKGDRKQGLGSEVMEDITALADKEQIKIVLTPGSKDDHHGTTSRGRLVKFYKRFGFVENKGRNKDFRMNAGDMFRRPK